MKELLQKLKSRKFLITVWSILIISFIVFSGKSDFLPLAEKLLFIPISYLPVNALQKKILEHKS